MADGPAPAKGTLTVVSIETGDTTAVRCTYDNVELPVVELTATAIDGTNGGTVGPPVITKSADATAVSGATVAGTSSVSVSVTGSSGATGPASQSAVPGIELPPGVITVQPVAINGTDSTVRPGTAAECDAMRPGASQKAPSTSVSTAAVTADTPAP